MSSPWPLLTVMVVLGLLIRLAFAPAAGHVVDIGTGEQWAQIAAVTPWDQVYARTNCNLPPAGMLYFELVGWLYTVLHVPPSDPDAMRIIFKLPGIVFDEIAAVALYALVRRYAGFALALLAAALLIFNPAVIYNSAYWGQNDSITAAFMIVALWLAARGQRIAAWPVLAYAVLGKPQVLVIAPLLTIEPFLTRDSAERMVRVRSSAAGIVLAAILVYLIALPFYSGRSFIGVYQAMISWYVVGSSLYPWTTVNAFNLYALFNDFFVSDNTSFLFVPIKYWADALFCAAVALVAWRYAKRGDGAGLAEGAFLILFALFLFLTEMHERYGLFALMLAPALAVLDRRLLWVYGVFTLTTWLNMEYALIYLWVDAGKTPGLNPHELAPVLVHLCSLANLGAFFTAAYVFATREHGVVPERFANVFAGSDAA